MKNEIINVNNNKTKLSKIPNKKNIKLETKLKIIKNNYSNFIKKDNLILSTN